METTHLLIADKKASIQRERGCYQVYWPLHFVVCGLCGQPAVNKFPCWSIPIKNSYPWRAVFQGCKCCCPWVTSLHSDCLLALITSVLCCGVLRAFLPPTNKGYSKPSSPCQILAILQGVTLLPSLLCTRAWEERWKVFFLIKEFS